MRVIFSVIGLLVAVAIVGLLAKRQLQAMQPAALPASASAASGPGADVPLQSLPSQVSDDVKKALEQGMRRNEAGADK